MTQYIGESWAQNGLVWASHLNGNSNDFSGGSRNGTDTNVTYSLANGKFGQGAYYNGSNAVTTVSYNAIFNSYPITIAAWHKVLQTSDMTSIMTYVAGSYNGWSIFAKTSQVGASYFRDASNKCDVTRVSYTFDTSKWYYIVATFDSSGGKVYVNSNLVTSTAWTGTAGSCTATSNMTIGKDPSNAYYWNGYVDEVNIYNVSKSANWVREQYGISVGKFQ